MGTQDATLMARWPEHVIDRVASRSFVLVLGAGTSGGCKNDAGRVPPGWRELLKLLAEAYTTGTAKTAALRLVAHEDYLQAAELIRVRSRGAGKEQDFLKKVAEVTDGGRKTEDQYQPVALHDALLRLEPDVLVTTNYDRVLERATKNGYNVHRYDSTTLGSDVRSGTPVLIKIHGSVDSVSELVLTRSDYSRLRRQGAHVLEVLQALFLTRTALFIGYSFSDPDIHLLLENVLGARGDVPAHYLLTGHHTPGYVRDIYAHSYGTTTVTYKSGDYNESRRMVELLGDEVGARRAGLQ
jgi:hypothetical protein